jgi:multicomponent Na+:H+ antiporter subunit B
LKFLYLILTLVTGTILIFGALDMPEFGRADTPPNTHVSPRYIEKTLEETHVPNIVTAVLADYRGFDTLGETTVVFAAGISVLLILRKPKKEKKA